MRANAIVDIIKIRLFREEDVRSFLITSSFFFCSLIAAIIDFSKFISLSGIILEIEASFTVASCFRLSIRGLASDAFTGVIRSTQYDESLGVRTGIIIIRIVFFKMEAYRFIMSM